MIGTILDIETTGYLKFMTLPDGTSVLSDESEILEVGFINVDMKTCRPLTHGVLYFYKPYFNVESEAQSVHKITRGFISAYEDKFQQNLIALNALMQNAIIIGKNSERFDIPFIEAFINKHGGTKMNIPHLVKKVGMKGYYGGTVSYDKDLSSLDMQSVYKNRFKKLYADKYGVKLGYNVIFEESLNKFEQGLGIKLDNAQISTLRGTHDMLIGLSRMDTVYPIPSKQALSAQKRGTLTEYVDVIPNGRHMVDTFYESLTKERYTGAHGALYDCVATLVVWLEAKANGLC